jgi:hypothetical protein
MNKRLKKKMVKKQDAKVLAVLEKENVIDDRLKGLVDGQGVIIGRTNEYHHYPIGTVVDILSVGDTTYSCTDNNYYYALEQYVPKQDILVK